MHGDHISRGRVTRAAPVRLFVNLFSAILLQCDYYSRGHLDKVDRSDYWKITIHSAKVSCQL